MIVNVTWRARRPFSNPKECIHHGRRNVPTFTVAGAVLIVSLRNFQQPRGAMYTPIHTLPLPLTTILVPLATIPLHWFPLPPLSALPLRSPLPLPLPLIRRRCGGCNGR